MVDGIETPLVVKLGGSLAVSGRLAGVADLVARARYPVVVVPGGGMFADGVRRAQRDLALSDALAHELALLSLHQMAYVIAARHDRFVPVATVESLTSALASERVPVWLPFDLQRHDATVPADWSTTSDALAARLAERLGCGRVALVKSCALPTGLSLDAAVSAGIVDPVFGTVVKRAGLDWTLYGAGQEAALATRLGK